MATSLKMATIGKVKNINEIEWKIPYFSSLSRCNSYYSPTFSFCNESWCFEMCLRWYDEIKNIIFISLSLIRMSSSTPINTEYSLGLKTLTGRKYLDKHGYYNFEDAEDYTDVEDECDFAELMSKDELFIRKDDLFPSDVITVFCSMKLPTSPETLVEKVSDGECFLCGKILDADNLSVHQKKDKAVKCADCSAVLTLQNWCDHQCQEKQSIKSTSAMHDLSLSEDFLKMLQDGISHDIILKIHDREIRAHKDVLRARSPVFKSLFEHDMKEKNSGVIDVSDCDPQAMELFLSYVYGGKVDALHENNMLQLYYIADKYEMIGLKNECCSFIKQFLSPTNFCDVIQLALNHSDSDLCDFATEYFITNVLDILQTVEWQAFLKDNCTVANELFIKSHKNKK